MTPYIALRSVYRLFPSRLRHWVYKSTPAPLRPLRSRIVTRLEETGSHDEVYDAEYFAKFVEPTMQISADHMADTIVDDLALKSVVDLGCGTGTLLASLRDRGLQVRGLEYAEAAIETCRRRNLEVRRYDIESDPLPTERGDIAISTEVAEHIPERCADRFADALASLADTIVLTAAVPGSGGTDHVNEQPNEYWIEKMARRGFRFDQVLSRDWRKDWDKSGVANCFASTVMIFHRGDAA